MKPALSSRLKGIDLQVLVVIPVFSSHTEASLSGTADDVGVDPTPDIVSHSVLIALHAVNN